MRDVSSENLINSTYPARKVFQRPTLAEIVQAHGNLTETNTYFYGSCPGCGGIDRFTVRKADAIINCRGCQPGGTNPKAFQKIIQNLPLGQRPLAKAKTTLKSISNPARSGPLPTNKAEYLFNRGQPIAGSPAQDYLASRGISLSTPNLRYLFNAIHGDFKQRLPALLVRFDHTISGELTAVQKIFFLIKEKQKRKRFTGSPKHCGVLVSGNQTNETIVVTEGLEDALSIAQVVQDKMNIAIWATGGDMGLKHFIPPQTARNILIAADNDQAGIAAAKSLGARVRDLRLFTKIVAPTKPGTDWNDLLISGDNHQIINKVNKINS